MAVAAAAAAAAANFDSFLKLNFLYFHFYLQSHRPSPNAHPLTIFLLFKQFNDTFTLFIYPLTKSNKRINTKC
jgi:hypothetical protein